MTHRGDQLFIYVRALNQTGDCLLDVKVAEVQVAPTQDGIATISAEVTAVNRSGAMVVARPAADVRTGLPDGSSFTVGDAVPATREQLVDNNGQTFKVPAIPLAIAPRPPSLRAYVSNFSSGKVSVIDTATNSVATTIPAGRTSVRLAITPNGRFAYVANRDSQDISVIDTTTNAVTSIALPSSGLGPVGVAFAPDGRYAYVTNQGYPGVFVIDTTTKAVTSFDIPHKELHDIAITPDGKFAYIAETSAVYVVDLATNKFWPVAGIDAGVGAIELAITPNGALAYAEGRFTSAESFVVDTGRNAVVNTIPAGGIDGFSIPGGLAITPDGRFAYITTAAADTVSAIDIAQNRVLATVNVGRTPTGVAIATTADGTFAYVANLGSGTVSVINTATNRVTATVRVGGEPTDIAIVPASQFGNEEYGCCYFWHPEYPDPYPGDFGSMGCTGEGICGDHTRGSNCPNPSFSSPTAVWVPAGQERVICGGPWSWPGGAETNKATFRCPCAGDPCIPLMFGCP